jgi:hypothetical protein
LIRFGLTRRQPSGVGLAGTCYQAVKTLGGLNDTESDLDRAERQLATAEASHRTAVLH